MCNETREKEWHSFFGYILDTDQQKYTSDTSMAAVHEKSNLADAVQPVGTGCAPVKHYKNTSLVAFPLLCLTTENWKSYLQVVASIKAYGYGVLLIPTILVRENQPISQKIKKHSLW